MWNLFENQIYKGLITRRNLFLLTATPHEIRSSATTVKIRERDANVFAKIFVEQ